MMNKQLVAKWSEQLSQQLGRSASEISVTGLYCHDFSADYVELYFEDESYCKFNDALVILNGEKNEVAVFTEHCGYFEFSSLGMSIYTYKDKEKHILIESDGIF
ncbi:hypothetical protein JCM19237_6207 [Photobacterium aphoticum]|uniref:Uncharacterized protein n=1 Tax=Photobacterium aphoticum TaxID=754436 RepID=A0A090QNB0_9GAMM|nr:hypothetical protein JCM19237_6207 [Photobacterium aphoticum]